MRDGRRTRLVPVVSTLTSAGAGWDGLALESFDGIPAVSIPVHDHPTHLLSLLVGAPVETEWTMAGVTRWATNEPGSIYLLPRGTRDHQKWKGPSSRIVVTVEPRLLSGALEETAHQADIELRPEWQLQDRHLASLMVALHADLQDGSPAGRLFGESLGTALAVYLARRYGVQPIMAPALRGRMPGHRLRRVLDYIGAEAHCDPSLQDLARVAGMSAHYFAELFRQSTGMAPHRYVLARRIDRAKELLRNPVLSILDIALQTGFASQSHFTKVFRRLTGATPSEYRSQV